MPHTDLSRSIRQAREHRHLTQEALADRVGCSAPYITILEKGRSMPSPDMAVKLERALAMKPGSLLQRTLTRRVRMPSRITPAVEESPPSELVPLVRVAPVSARFIGASETEASLPIPREVVRGRRMYLVRMHGDALDAAHLQDGDVLLVDADAEPRHGELVVARVQGRSLIRRFERTDHHTRLAPLSSNPAHRPTPLDRGPAELLRGVVDAVYLKRLR